LREVTGGRTAIPRAGNYWRRRECKGSNDDPPCGSAAAAWHRGHAAAGCHVGNWAESASWDLPADAVFGINVARGSPASRAYKVSYNRPFGTRDTGPEDFVFNSVYPMVQFTQANGFVWLR
jgi:hypothetical protein